jgi:UDP-glucose 4-epimerase
VYNVGANDENHRIRDVATLISEEIDTVNVTYLEDEHPGPSYHVNFDRMGETGFELDYSLREGVRELATRFRG